MTREEALKVLGLEAGAPVEVIKYTAGLKKKELQGKITAAPTDALKDKFQQVLDNVNSAEQGLIQNNQQQSSPQKSSSLSQTKMADLPGVSPHTGSDNVESSVKVLQPGDTLLNRASCKTHKTS